MEPPSGRGGDRRSPLAALEQSAAEIYVEAQAVNRRIKTDRAFTTAHQRVALAGLRDQCLGVAALLGQIDAQKEST
jgi:hypothetical protein